jgi:hypothetical protein
MALARGTRAKITVVPLEGWERDQETVSMARGSRGRIAGLPREVGIQGKKLTAPRDEASGRFAEDPLVG